MATVESLQGLVGRNLDGFKIVEMTEVFRVDNDGNWEKSLGFFKNQDIAVVFAGAQTDANWHKTRQVLVLTDGTVGFAIEQQEPVKLFNDEEEALKLRQGILNKLTLAERGIMGFGK